MCFLSEGEEQVSMKPVNNENGQLFSRGDDPIDLYTQLWHECAGSTVKIPRKGDKVFYFPQGHLEQVEAYMKQEGTIEIPSYGLPSIILCKVVHVQLKAEAITDEVFAQITLIPECEVPEESNLRSVPQKVPSISFRKILTNSDANTPGGCTLRRRYAEGCLPPLDMSQDLPSQKLVAKDLHGSEWHFKHIYRGKPKRHMLTNGWSMFVSAKRLVAGDACIFIRGRNELYVGVRRAMKPQNGAPATPLSSLSMQHGILATAAHALKTRTMFTVYYHPRTSPTEFIVDYNHFMKSTQIHYSFGVKFRMSFDNGGEDPEYRITKFSGTVVGVEDLDHITWPSSVWRCLKVQWHTEVDGLVLPERVSPWSIQPLDLTMQSQRLSVSFNPTRSRLFEPVIPNLPFVNTNDYTQERQLAVLQGQEIRENTGLTFLKNDYSPIFPHQDLTKSTQESRNRKKCKLFGVDIGNSNTCVPSPSATTSQLTPSDCVSWDILEQQCQNYSSLTTRSCIKVQKHGTALGRSIDLARFDGYDGLISELDRMFDFEGTLVNKTNGWLIIYADGDGDKMLLGDISWLEFRRAAVKKMFICPKEEVDGLAL